MKPLKIHWLVPLLLAFVLACTQKNAETVTAEEAPRTIATETDTDQTELDVPNRPDFSKLPDTAFVDITRLSDEFLLDIKYATSDNFTGQVLYPCGECLLRKIVADSLIAANRFFMEKGYRLKLFDCYRPHAVQKKMWTIMPDDRYVADPAKGSMHNRGGAIDLTLVSLQTGEELDMGSPFDFFGPASHHINQSLPKPVLERRVFLRESLARFGFKHITSEWWHYSFEPQFFAIADAPLPCE
jgi:D-alanyl-D-alanine dipeptidase